MTLAFFYTSGQQADFIANKVEGCAPLSVSFTDQSIGSITSRTWKFGNGNTSSLQNPSAIYADPGIYTVELTVSNGSSSDTETKTGYIVVFASPTVNFALDQVKGCAPLLVNFTDQSTAGSGVITNWNWVFGDGGSEQTQNPSHTYVIPGQQNVTLTVVNQHGCIGSTTKNSAVEVQGVHAGFTNNNDSFCAVPAEVTFTNTSTGNGALTYSWTFGDGTTSTEQNITHTYTKKDIYPVTLEVTDAQGCKGTFAKNIFVGNQGGLDFSASATKVCIGQAIQFTQLNDATILSQEWDFGDGSTTTNVNPIKSFTKAGKYKVKFSAQLAGKPCGSEMVKEIEVIANPAPDFNYTQTCTNEIKFTNRSGRSVAWLWIFGDGATSTDQTPNHIFPATGPYKVTLQAFNELNCSISIEKEVIVPGPPLAAFMPDLEQDCLAPSLSGCAPFTLNPTNLSISSLPIKQILWDFGDGTTSDEHAPEHIYNTKGTFDLSLTVTNSIGCKSVIARKVNVKDVTPVAKFSIDTTDVCTRIDKITFTDESTNADFFCWDYGDGQTGTGKISSHSYTTPGVYTIKLLAKNAGCTDEFVLTDAVTIKGPNVEIDMNPKDCKNPHDITFTNASFDYSGFQWDFSDGSDIVTNTFAPKHHFADTGTYNVKFTAYNTTTGCTVSDSLSVLIQEIHAAFSVDNVKPCLGESVAFTDKSESAVAWSWMMSDTTITVQNPTFTFDNPGLYNVKLVVSNSDLCTDELEMNDLIQVINIRAGFSYSAVSDCDTLTVNFTDLSQANPPVDSWHWTFGDGKTSSETSPQHHYLTKNTFDVQLTLINSEGECNTQPIPITFNVPKPEFILPDPEVCIGESLSLINSSTLANKFEWHIGNNYSGTEIHPNVSFSEKGKYDVSLKATDDFGCTVQLLREDFISVTKPVAQFSSSQTSAACPPLTVKFSNNSSEGSAWKWAIGDGQSSILESPEFTFLRPGIYDVSLIAIDDNNCSDTTTVADIIQVGGPDGTIDVFPLVACAGDTIQFHSETQNTILQRWDFGDGVTHDVVESEIHHPYSNAGTFKVTAVFADENGCEVASRESFAIMVHNLPAVSFTYRPLYPFEGESVELTASSEDAEEFQWIWLNQVIASGEEDSYIFEEPGLKDVTLRAVDPRGCLRDTTQQIFVQANIPFIPNVFTPNGDPIHETFQIPKVEEGFWNLKVYNRWGKIVHEENNYKSGWKGQGLSSGVYYYTLTNAYRKEKFYKGYVHILY